ncbi:MAG: hypothetical protein ACYC9R_05935 [Nitrosotalea sp.]
MLKSFKNLLIRYAKRTPYFHLDEYMERYWLLQPAWYTFGIGIRLHIILRSDKGRHLHDHPWWWIAWLLEGSYHEVDLNGTHWIKEGSIRSHTTEYFHRLEINGYPRVVSLFIMGPRKQMWGFLVNDKKIPYQQYDDLYNYLETKNENESIKSSKEQNSM